MHKCLWLSARCSVTAGKKIRVVKPTSRQSHLVAELKITAQLIKLSVKWWSKSVLIIKWCKLIKAVQDKPFWHKLTCLSQWTEKFFSHKMWTPLHGNRINSLLTEKRKILKDLFWNTTILSLEGKQKYRPYRFWKK